MWRLMVVVTTAWKWNKTLKGAWSLISHQSLLIYSVYKGFATACFTNPSLPYCPPLGVVKPGQQRVSSANTIRCQSHQDKFWPRAQGTTTLVHEASKQESSEEAPFYPAPTPDKSEQNSRESILIYADQLLTPALLEEKLLVTKSKTPDRSFLKLLGLSAHGNLWDLLLKSSGHKAHTPTRCMFEYNHY